MNKGHDTKLIAIHGMTPVSFQESGSRSKPRLSIQRNYFLPVACCSCLSRQSFVHANTGEKLLLGAMHIPAQIHDFFSMTTYGHVEVLSAQESMSNHY